MKSFTIGETDRRTAEKIKTKFDNQFAQGIVPKVIEKTPTAPAVVEPTLGKLRELARDFAGTNKDPLTLKREQDALSAVISILGDIKLSDLTPAKLETYKTKRLKNVAAATVNIEIRVLNTALAQAFTLGWLKEKHGHRYKQIQIPDAEAPEVLNEEEIQQLLQNDDVEFRGFMSFLLLTGCRRNEALGMRWEDLDLTKKQIVVRGEVGKMGKRRTIPISTALELVLNSLPGDHSGLLFPNFGPNQVSMKFRRWIRQLGMRKSISLHSMRSTFACHLIQKVLTSTLLVACWVTAA